MEVRVLSWAPIFLLLGASSLAAAQAPLPAAEWRDAGIVFTNRSPQARLRSVPVRAVKLGAGFWAARVQANRRRSLPSMLELLEEHGVVDNFRRVSGRKQVARRGPLYTDSDLFKWMEAAAFTLQTENHPELRALLDKAVEEVLAAQQPDGYLNTYYILERAGERFTDFRRGHELYCLGHLIQAAVAIHRATGERKLLDAAVRYADYVVATMGPDKKPALTGHPELEMALVELYRTTGNRNYLRFAGYALSGVERERLQLSDRDVVYMFSGIPFTARTKLEGHSVRAMYAASGATDYYAETGDGATRRTLETLWQDLVARKMYITGGVGSRAVGEAIGEPYELPNEQAYTETCAAIGNLMWNWRLLLVTGEARYTDVLERALYNGVLAGVSLSGDQYFYRNPLEALGKTRRQPWYSTTCCPPNIQRTLAALPGYFYSTSAEGVWVHLFHNSELEWRLENGAALAITQQTGYPWQNSVELTVNPARPARFTLFVRIPGWTRQATVAVNGQGIAQTVWPGSYLGLNRNWSKGDRVKLAFDMPARFVQANPRVREALGRVAVERGPLVYCAEAADQPRASLFDLWLPIPAVAAAQSPGVPGASRAAAAAHPSSTGFTAEFRPELLGGVTVLSHDALVAPVSHAAEPLYGPLRARPFDAARRIKLTLIPYSSWANREPAEMQVWFPWTAEPAPPAPRPLNSSARNRPLR